MNAVVELPVEPSSGLSAEILQHTQLVVHLRAARDEDEGPLDPGTLLLVLSKLARLCHGEALDPQTGELLE